MPDDDITEGLRILFEREVYFQPDGCWIWKKCSKRRHHYGYVVVTYNYMKKCLPATPTRCIWVEFKTGNGIKFGAHRYVAMAKYGEIPEGLIVRHTCDVPACINPDHLLLGTRRDNVHDMIERGRAAWQKKAKATVMNTA